METSQVVCSSPAFCKLEPESPPSWETPVDFTESNFGEFWPEEWEDVKDSVGIKNFAPGDALMDLDLLLKEEPFNWIDERNDSLYSSFDWPQNDVKIYNCSTSPIEQKSFGELTSTASTNTTNNIINSAGNAVIGTSSTGGVSKAYLTGGNNNGLVFTSSSLVVASAAAAETTPDLLKEFEDVLIGTTTASLTPPDSPRDQTTSLITLLQEIEPCSSSSNDIDAIVATQAENMVPHNLPHHHQQSQYLQKEQQSPASPDPWSSPSMGSGSSSSCSDSGYDDPDWSPSSPPAQSATSTSLNGTSTRRKRAAATSTEERKMRKKEQNKNAATRYRQKKKQEIEVIIGEERELLEKHEHLKADVTEITREIRYLKSLLRDLYKAKGIIS